MDPVGGCQLFLALWECCSPHVGYLDDIKGKAHSLKDDVDDLSALMKDVETEVKASGPEATAQASRWLEKADSRRRHASALIDHVEQNMEGEGGEEEVGHGCCINCTSRYKTGKRIAKASKEVASLKEEGQKLKVTSSRPVPNPSVAPPPAAGNGANKPNPPVETSAPPTPANPDGLLSSRGQLPPKPETRDERNGRDHREDRKPVALPSSPSFGDAPAKRVADRAAQATPVVGY